MVQDVAGVAARETVQQHGLFAIGDRKARPAVAVALPVTRQGAAAEPSVLLQRRAAEVLGNVGGAHRAPPSVRLAKVSATA